MKLKRCTSIILAAIMTMTILSGCSTNEKEGNAEQSNEAKQKISVNVVAPDGLPSIAIAKLIKENPDIDQDYDIKYTIEQTSETLSTSVMKEVPDIAIVPSNMASIAYNKTNNYKIAGTTGFGSSYVVSTEEINSYEDLKGKNIVNIGKGLTPDITAQYILKSNDLDLENDLTLGYVNSPSELVPMIVARKENTAVIPEPALTSLVEKKEDINIFKSLNDEYKQLTNSGYGYPQATIIVKDSFITDNKEFIDEFLLEVNESIEWANSNKDELGSYCEEIGISTQAPIIVKSMDRANLQFVHIKDSQDIYTSYYDLLFDYNPASLGGKLPDEGIFFK